jgi:peptide/nickel transport system permease protein
MSARLPARFTDFLATGVIGLALLGTVYTPHDPRAQDFRGIALSGPRPGHWLGIDGLGRDFLSRLWEGAGHTVGLSLAALLLTLALAGTLVALERLDPGRTGRLIRALVGLWVALPVIFIGLLLLVFLDPSPRALILAVGLGNLPLAFRQLRVFWLQTRGALHVQASEVLGARGWPLFRWAIWPALLPDLLALARLLFAMSALELSGLAFLGLIGDPDFTELGSILKQNQVYLYQTPSLVILPGLILSLILMSVHLSRFRRST